MTTRHVSAHNDYPFIPPLSLAAATATGGLLDAFFVIQGDPSFSLAEGSSEAESSGPYCSDEILHQVRLVSYALSGTNTVFTFQAKEGLRVWVLTFTVPNVLDPGKTGQVSNDDSTDCRAVLIFDSSKVAAGSGFVDIELEQARTQWHTEQVAEITLMNIFRCDGVENSSSFVPAAVFGGAGSSDLIIPWEDGYNCEVAFESDAGLRFLAGVGIGKGTSPDFGDTTSSCGSSEGVTETGFVSTINGFVPVNGDIPVTVSNGLGKQKARGKLQLVTRV